MIGNESHIGLADFFREVLNRNRIFKTDRGLDAELSAERLDLIQIIAGAYNPQPDERKSIVEDGQCRQRGVETEAPRNRAVANNRKRFAFRFASHYSWLDVAVRYWENAGIRRVGYHHQLLRRYSGKMQALSVQIVAGQDLVPEARPEAFLKHHHPLPHAAVAPPAFVLVPFRQP